MNLKLILMVLIALAAVTPGLAIASPVLVDTLSPSWDTGVYSVYYGPSNGYAGASPGVTAVYDGREAAPIYAGLTTAYDDQGLFAFKPAVSIETFATQTLTYDFVNEDGVNPVWVYIELDKGGPGDIIYQYVPTSNPAAWHTEDAATGAHWQAWTNLADGIPTGPLLTLAEIATANPGKMVDRVYLTQGMGESYYNGGVGTKAWVDKVVIGSVTYDFVAPVLELTATPAPITILKSPLMGATGGVATSNAALDAATATRTPIQVRLTNIGGADSANVRIRPVGDATGHIQFWAKDSLGNWYDINIVGWGPGTGFPVPAGYDATTDVYAISDVAGTYSLNAQLETVADHAVVASVSGDVVVEADTTPPVTTATATSNAFSTWTFVDVQVTLACADTESGCATTYVCIDAVDACTPTDAYTVPFTLTDKSYVRYYSVDNEGNAETVQSRLVKIDKTGPVYGDVTLSPSYLDGATLYISELSDISAPVSDAESEIVECYYTIDGTTSLVSGGTYDSGVCTFTDVNTLGASSIAVGGINGAGAATWSAFKTVTVDSDAPVLGVTSPVADSYLNSNSVVFSGTLSDMAIQWLQGDLYYASGAGITAIGFGTDPTFSYTRDFTTMPDDRYKIIYTAGDRVGHQTIVEVNFAVDRTEPIITGDITPLPNAAGWYDGDVVVHFGASDALSGIADVTPDTTVSTEGAAQVVVGTAIDNAGNIATYDYGGINIDKTAPATTDNIPVGWQTAVVTVTLVPYDALALGSTVYCFGTDPSCVPDVPYTAPIVVDAEGLTYFNYVSTDLAGNVQAVSKQILIDTDDNVDTTPEDLGQLFTTGVFVPVVESTDLEVTRDTTIGMEMNGGTTEIVLPEGLIISGGPTFNPLDLMAAVEGSDVVTGLPSRYSFEGGVIEWGVANLGLTFSVPITINMYVGAEYNGQTLHVLRATSTLPLAWTTDGLVDTTCTVSDGFCTFRTTKASYYATTTYTAPSSGGRSGGGGGTCLTGYTRVDGNCVKETAQPEPPKTVTPPAVAPTSNAGSTGNDAGANQPVANTAGSGAAAPTAQGDLLTGQVTGDGAGIQSWIWLAAIVGFILIGAVTYLMMRKR